MLLKVASALVLGSLLLIAVSYRRSGEDEVVVEREAEERLESLRDCLFRR